MRRAEALIERGDLEGAPINSVELALALYKDHPNLEGRIPRSLTTKGLWSVGVRRAGPPEVGDMLLFKPLKGTLEVAFVLEVVEGQALRAVAITRGAPRLIYAHLKLPHTRRLDGELINSYVRRATPSRSSSRSGSNELEGGGYLAGELLDEVRAIF